MGRKISLRKVGTGFLAYEVDEKLAGLVGLKRSLGWNLTGPYLWMMVLRVWYRVWYFLMCPSVTWTMAWDIALSRLSGKAKLSLSGDTQGCLSERSQQLNGWAGLNLMKFNREKYGVGYLGQDNCVGTGGMGRLKSSSAGESMQLLWPASWQWVSSAPFWWWRLTLHAGLRL